MKAMLQAVVALAPVSAPILVLSFAASDAPHTHDPRAAAMLLGLHEMNKVVSVRNVPESTDYGVAEGFEWLTEMMENN